MQVVLEIPDSYSLNNTTEELAKRVKLYAALFMFQSGQLSTGAACEFAGLDRYSFLEICKQHHIKIIDYDEDELENDFEHLKQSYANRC